MCCYLYDPERRKMILEEAESTLGCFAHLPGYGMTFETAMLMVGEGLLYYEGTGSYTSKLRATAAGRAELERLAGI